MAGVLEGQQRRDVARQVPVAQEVESHSADQGLLGPDAVDGLLHLAVSAIPTLHRVGSRGAQGIVQEGEGLLEVGAGELLQGLADLFEAADPVA